MLPEPDPATCAALADDLRGVGFTSENLRAAWGESADDATGRELRAPALRALGDRTDPLAVLGRLFALGAHQPTADVAAALPRCGVEGLERLGLATAHGETVHPAAVLRPQSFADDTGEGEWWIASDLDEMARGGTLPEDHVLGVGGASRTLAALQVPTPAARVLDLGTGCGIQALRARRFADTVVATDISEGAVRFTRLNALLNGVEGIETRVGNLFDPVAGERFDRVVSNPPFVITPRAAGVPAYEYRDGGLVGDALVEAVVTGVGEVLEPGGVAQFLGNWETRDGVDGLERVRDWVAASPVPLDAWVVEREQLDPLAYAELWIRDGGTVPTGDRFARLLDAWLDDFDARGVTAVGFGSVLLRRAVGRPTLSRYERVGTALGARAIGGHIAGALEAHDRIAGLGDADLAACVLRTAPDVTEARHHMPGAEDPMVIELRQGGGYGRALSVDPGLAALVGACDGDLAVGVLIGAIAQLLEVDAASLQEDLLPRVRELIVTGFLAVVD
ncbi:DUF7059 domain-containing protein [Microbacterium xanthum]|uniref:DUF7059 domain-containing protein n=1 Tax=Microbacterium xanthum TaxID=3079794 RepID=UPI002AD58091|nr:MULTISPECIES: methyltransferase [unclassified Microbacterium]MDZ8173128.1 methyltransferase [Microbacterium sp. KSW-48]MDZ8200719.1 methyltransferase [Microbacterium sp. SSW1-59]